MEKIEQLLEREEKEGQKTGSERLDFGNYEILMKKSDFKTPEGFINANDEENIAELKKILLDTMNYVDFEIVDKNGQETIGREFDDVREKIWTEIYEGKNEKLEKSQLIKEALQKNHLAINRVNYVDFLVNAMTALGKAKKEKLAYDELMSNFNKQEYSSMPMAEKKEFIKKIDQIGNDLFKEFE